MRTKEEVIREVEHLTEIHSTIREVDEVYFETLIQETKHYKLWDELVHVYCNLANVYANGLNKMNEAQRIINLAELELRNCKVLYTKARMYTLKGNLFKIKHEHFNAIKSIKQAIKILNRQIDKTVNQKERETLFYNYFLLSIIYNTVEEIEISDHYIKKAQETAFQINSDRLKLMVLTKTADFMIDRNNFIEAKKTITKALSLSKEINNEYLHARALSVIAKYYLKAEKYQLALDNYLKSLSIYEAIYPNQVYCDEYCVIAEIYISINEIDKAKKYYDKAYQKSIFIYNKRQRIGVLKSICTFCEQYGEWESMIKYMKEIEILKDELYKSEKRIQGIELEQRYQDVIVRNEQNNKLRRKREVEQVLYMEQLRYNRIKQVVSAMGRSIKKPMIEGKQLLSILLENGIKNAERDTILMQLQRTLLRIGNLQEALNASLEIDAVNGGEKRIEAESIMSELNTKLNEKTQNSRKSKTIQPKNHFIHQYIYALAEGAEQVSNQIILKQPNISAVLI